MFSLASLYQFLGIFCISLVLLCFDMCARRLAKKLIWIIIPAMKTPTVILFRKDNQEEIFLMVLSTCLKGRDCGLFCATR